MVEGVGVEEFLGPMVRFAVLGILRRMGNFPI